MSDPKISLMAMLAAETSHSKASVEEIDGKIYFHNPEAASSAMVLVNAVRRGKKIKISDREDHTSKSTLGLAMENFDLGISHSTTYSRSRSIDIEFYEPSVSDHIVEILKVAPHWEPEIVIKAIEMGTKILQTGVVGAMDPIAAKNEKPLYEEAELIGPPGS